MNLQRSPQVRQQTLEQSRIRLREGLSVLGTMEPNRHHSGCAKRHDGANDIPKPEAAAEVDVELASKKLCVRHEVTACPYFWRCGAPVPRGRLGGTVSPEVNRAVVVPVGGDGLRWDIGVRKNLDA